MIKNICHTLLIALFFMAPTASSSAESPKIGMPAPDFTGTDTLGNEISLSSLRGKTVILEWTNHECPYVKKHYKTGNMQALQKEATQDENIVWLSVVSSAPGRQGYTTPDRANAVMEQVGAASTARILDPEGSIGRLYEAKTTPHMFVIDPEGALVYQGAIDDMPDTNHESVTFAKNFVRMAMNAMENGQEIDPDNTRPYGCSVKYSPF